MKKQINSELKNISGLEYDEKGYPTLNVNNIKKVDDYVKNSSSYAISKSHNFLKDYFKSTINNVTLETIMIRVILVDTTESTNLKLHLGKDYYKIMAKKIFDAEIEDIIKQGRPLGRKFEEIAKFPPKKNSKKDDTNLFVFLSKYITRVSEYCYDGNYYSIMDNVVKNNLYRLTNIDETREAKLEKLRQTYNYDGYCEKMHSILNKLPNVTRDELDHFVWFSFKPEAAGDKKN